MVWIVCKKGTESLLFRSPTEFLVVLCVMMEMVLVLR